MDEFDKGIGTDTFQIEQKNSFKIIKNTKGFNYEFKIIEDDLELLKKKVLEMNEWAKLNFGDKKE